jgi:hypothetical protein
MSAAPVNVEQWKQRNRGNVVQCRWGCEITLDACRAYQSRTVRYVLHFNGDRVPLPRVNAEYVRCFVPDACPHLLSDEEAHEALEARRRQQVPSDRMSRQHRGRIRERLIDPDDMLREEPWRRSLLAV